MSDAFEEFGPYLVYERLGQGGMATVHRAEKRGVGIRRPVALKRLLPHIASDPTLVELFVDEARLASQLHHANIAQIYELGKVGETFFIAMEYASGPTLAQVVRQCHDAAGIIPLPITVNILSQVCDALDYAHNLCDPSGESLRIVHRDISPANIIVTNTGIVKLIDFGIAKATISRVKTQTGFIKGKFGYIAPEYLTGKIDARADLFALGVVAHEMLSGRRLFEGKDDFEILAKIREMKIVPPSQINTRVTPDIDTIVMTALQRDPAQRWQSAAALQLALAQVARQLGTVIGSGQLAEWVDWAFSQVPPPRDRSADSVRKASAFGRDRSSLAIEIQRGGDPGDAGDDSEEHEADDEGLPATWPPEPAARPRKRRPLSDSERTLQVAARAAMRAAAGAQDPAPPAGDTGEPPLRGRDTVAEPSPRRISRIRDAVIEPPPRSRDSVVELVRRGDDADTPPIGRDDADLRKRRTSRIRDAVIEVPSRGRDALAEPVMRLEGAETTLHSRDDAGPTLRSRDDAGPAPRRTPRSRDVVDESALGSRPGGSALDTGDDGVLVPRPDDAETMLRSRDEAEPGRRISRMRSAVELPPRTMRSRDSVPELPPRTTRSRDSVPELRAGPRNRDVIAELPLRAADSEPPGLPERFGLREPSRLSDALDSFIEPGGESDILDVLAESSDVSGAFDAIVEPPGLDDALDAFTEPPGAADDLDTIAPTPPARRSPTFDAIPPLTSSRPSRLSLQLPPVAARASSAPSNAAEVPSLTPRYEAPLAPGLEGIPALPRPAPDSSTGLPAHGIPRASPPAWQVVPPASTDAAEFAPDKPARRLASRAEPQAAPSTTRRGAPDDRAKATQKTRPTSRYAGSLVLRILLMLVLGACAMAAAYFWPDL